MTASGGGNHTGISPEKSPTSRACRRFCLSAAHLLNKALGMTPLHAREDRSAPVTLSSAKGIELGNGFPPIKRRHPIPFPGGRNGLDAADLPERMLKTTDQIVIAWFCILWDAARFQTGRCARLNAKRAAWLGQRHVLSQFIQQLRMILALRRPRKCRASGSGHYHSPSS